MKRNATVALGAALTTITPVGVALAAPTGSDQATPGPSPLKVRTQVHGPGSIETRMKVDGRRIATHRRLLERNTELTRTIRGLTGAALRKHVRKARRWSSARLRRENRALTRPTTVTPTGATSATEVAGGALAAIRACESGGNYGTNTGNGFYGAYQFTQSTWESVGGSGNPAAASPAEQDRRAAMLYSRSGSGQWPVCGR